jgi:hypothetical protein
MNHVLRLINCFNVLARTENEFPVERRPDRGFRASVDEPADRTGRHGQSGP